jgi:hypothetical protein
MRHEIRIDAHSSNKIDWKIMPVVNKKTIEPFLPALRILYARIGESHLDWAITGSLGFALQGVDVNVHDIDIQSNLDDVYKIESLLQEFVIEKVVFKSSPGIRSYFGRLQIADIVVELMAAMQKHLNDGNWEQPVDIRAYRRHVDFEGMHLPVLSLVHEQQAYLQMGRVEKAKMLADWLKEHPNY